jgi:hypothetical protein
MSLGATLETLHRELARLREAISALHVTVAEDRPACGAAMLVDQLDNVVVELSSTLEEAEARALQAREGNGSSPPDGTRVALREVHTLLNRFTALFAGELANHNRVALLIEMGRERGREWREWAQVVKTAIESCAAPMQATASALLECWSELTERVAGHSVSVQATNIGQQITTHEDKDVFVRMTSATGSKIWRDAARQPTSPVAKR